MSCSASPAGPATLGVAILLLALLAGAGCSGGGSASSSAEETGSAAPPPETTQKTGPAGGAALEQISVGSGAPRRPQVVVAPSAAALSEATGVRVPPSGAGTYLAAFWGEQPTGGYTVGFLSARTEGDRVVVRLALEKPPPDAMVSQALTYPLTLRTNSR